MYVYIYVLHSCMYICTDIPDPNSTFPSRNEEISVVHSCTQNGRKLLKNKEVFTGCTQNGRKLLENKEVLTLKRGLKKKTTRYKSKGYTAVEVHV